MSVLVDHLTFKVQVDVCIAVSEWVEGVAPVHAGVRETRVLDGQGQHVAMLLGLEALVADAGVLFDDLENGSRTFSSSCGPSYKIYDVVITMLASYLRPYHCRWLF